MTTKPKARKAAAANGVELDPVFAAIAEHKVLIKESNRLEKSYSIARGKAEKKHGWEWNAGKPLEMLDLVVANVDSMYDRLNRADRAERKAAMRMAKTGPTTVAGAAALIAHAWHEIEAGDSEQVEDWLTTALKTVAGALIRMSQKPA